MQDDKKGASSRKKITPSTNITGIINPKSNGTKGTVTEAKDDDEVKVTKVLEFIPATKKDAKEGKIIGTCTTWAMERYTGSREH